MRANRVVLLIPILLLLACGASARQLELKASLATMDTARDAFVTWDRQHQEALFQGATSADDARQMVASYRAKRESVLFAFELGYKAIAHAATLDDDLSLSNALNAILDLQAEITKIGASWPKKP